MTLPNGASGVVADIEWAVQYGALGGLASRTQDTVMAALQAEVQASQAWNRATAAVWADLRRGIPLVHAIIEAMVQRLLDTAEEFPGVPEALNAIQKVPGEASLVAALTGVPGDLDDATVFLGQQWSDLEWVATQVRNLLNAAGQLAGGDVGDVLAAVQSDLQSLVTGSVGSGGSGFPWTFPISFGTGSGFPWSFPVTFGDVQKDLSDVGSAILNAPQSGQQVLNTIVRSVTGVQTTIDHSLADLETAVAQLPASPPLAPVATGLQQAAGTASQMGAIIENAGQQTAAAVGGALASAGASATSAVNQLQDAAVNAIGGAATAETEFGAALAGAFGLWVNAATGSAVASAAAQDVANAHAAAAAAQAAQAAQTAAINAQLPHFYGGSGTSGLNAQVSLAGALPASFTVESSIAAYSAIYNLASASTDSETVSGIWTSPITSNGGARYLFLRVNSSFTTYLYAKWWLDGSGFQSQFHIEIGCVVGAVKTVLTTYLATSTVAVFLANLSANNVIDLEATGYAITLNYPSYGSYGGAISVTDSLQVSQVGASFRNGGFGTDESSQPGTISSFAFYDSGPTSGPSTALVATSESTSSTTYTDLTTTTDQVTVNIGASGIALVFISAELQNTGTQGARTFMGFAASGANTIAAADNQAISYQTASGGGTSDAGAPFLLAGLSPGATTFKAKYRTTAGTSSWSNRRIAVIPL